jgi:hypothetical protein
MIYNKECPSKWFQLRFSDSTFDDTTKRYKYDTFCIEVKQQIIISWIIYYKVINFIQKMITCIIIIINSSMLY